MDPLGRAITPEAQDSAELVRHPLPDELPAAMPIQDLQHWESTGLARRVPWSWPACLRRLSIFIASLALTALASYEMYRVLSVIGMTTLQLALLVVFSVNFLWIALPFVSGLVGFVVLWRGRSGSGITVPPLASALPLTTRTALLMPIYNEAPQRICAGLQAIYESLQALDALAHFDFFILSDTTDPDIWLQEEGAFAALRARTRGAQQIFYRHRLQNTRRKAGNIADFCQRWGARYAHMVILDADSLMTGASLVRLAAAMEAHPEAGLMQTLPLVVNRHSLFARLQQFAARLYGPVIAAGLAYWHLGDSSYWGHNAIIRTQAFLDHAGLPDLPGRPPFGGLILSHDFVEAALMRRAGWQVHLLPELEGSYEESPPSLIDFAERDRRWCQGNLQHSRLLLRRGFYWLSRFHLATGIMSYLASPLWLVFIGLGLLLALQARFLRPEYFPAEFVLFPTWPVFDPERAIRLFVGTMAVLIVPKLLGYILLWKNRHLAQGCGGRLRAGVSVLIETILSALIAPVMMLMQSAVVIGIVTGRDVGWKAQRRDDGSVALLALVRRHLAHTLFGLGLGIVAYAVSPPFLAWLSPVVLGLALAIPLSALTGLPQCGRALRCLGLLMTPEETTPPEVLRRTNELTYALARQGAPLPDAFTRLARSPGLQALHAAMLPPPAPRRKGEYEVDLLVGLAKLDDAESVAEASALLSTREKLMVLGHRRGFERFMRLVERQHRQAREGFLPTE
jgi:membrane glycosyltransferase